MCLLAIFCFYGIIRLRLVRWYFGMVSPVKTIFIPFRGRRCSRTFLVHLLSYSIFFIALSHRRFEASPLKFHCKRPFKGLLVKVRKELLQRSLSRKPYEQLIKGNKVCLVEPFKEWERWGIHNVEHIERQQSNTSKLSTQEEKETKKRNFRTDNEVWTLTVK